MEEKQRYSRVSVVEEQPYPRSGYSVVLREAKLNELEQLTAREREVLQLISHGHRDRDIAMGLYISEKKVQKHMQNILSKLRVQNRTEAAYLHPLSKSSLRHYQYS